MNHLINFKLFESNQSLPGKVTIEEFVDLINLPQNKKLNVISWWNENRKDFNIHFFTFNCQQPIGGVFLDEKTVAINQKLPMPPHIRLFLALHESGHCNQHSLGQFEEGYYETVLDGDKESFLRSYKELEKGANDFAINSMREIGFEFEMNMEEQRLRGNENAGEMVFRMMSEDIRRFNPTDFFDLLKKQIL